jgi:hypothetical protein
LVAGGVALAASLTVISRPAAIGGFAERQQRARDDGSLDRTGECRCSERRGV